MSIACIAHRGSSGNAPENTLLAFWTAIAAQADLIEFDVQITKDRQAVIFHDRSMERITGDKKGIADFTLSELKAKDVGKWKHEGFTGLRMPTLDEVLTELPQDTSLIVEVKPQNRDIEGEYQLEKLILNSLDDNRGGNGVGSGYISVRDEETYEWFKSNTSKYSIGMMQKKRTVSEYLDIVKNYKIQYSQIRPANYSEKDFTNLRETGTKTIVYYGDYPKEWDHFIANQVDGILTNYPSVLNGYLKQKQVKVS